MNLVVYMNGSFTHIKSIKAINAFYVGETAIHILTKRKNRSDKKSPFINTYYRKRTPSTAVFGTFLNLDYALTK